MKLRKMFIESFEDCGCKKDRISEGMQYHVDNDRSLTENIYRPFSKEYFELFKEARELYKKGLLVVTEQEEKILNNTDLGEYGYYKGIKVPLDYPMSFEQLQEVKHQGKEVELNKPKRSSTGSKKYVVFVRNSNGNIKKINFGDVKGGLKMKISDSKARKAFSKRHNCPEKKDKMTPGYWSCRLTRYGKLLGSENYPGYW